MGDLRPDKATSFLERVLPPSPGAEGRLEALGDPTDRVEAVLPSTRVPRGLEADVNSAAEKIATGQPLEPPEQFALEAIIIPDKRPAIDIVSGDYTVEHRDWTRLNEAEAKRTIKAAIPAIGRVELPGHPSLPYGGTGFVVGAGLLMTNRHVAEIFCGGVGVRDLVFRPGHRAGIDFLQELGGGSQFIEVRQVAMIHPYWDMALLRVEGLPATIAPLRLSTLDPDELLGRDVAVIGYPAFDPRNNAAVQNQVFKNVYNVKRLMPGKLNGRGPIQSFGKSVPSALHDSSTLGGASGSAVVDVATGQIVALHFAGRYLDTNFGVPAVDLARDARVVDAGVDFAGETPTSRGEWDAWWSRAAGEESGVAAANARVSVPSATPQVPAGGGARWTIPIEISVNIGSAAPTGLAGGAAAASVAAAPAPDEGVERAVEPIHDDSYDNRRGYQAEFLEIAVPLPEVTDEDAVARLEGGGYVVPYHHFSVVMHRARRLALFTAANVDASPERKRPEPDRLYTRDALGGLGKNDRERWFTDPRLRGTDQLPDRFFEKDNRAFDKGHLVRREDVAWGDSYAEVQAANGDTFHTTNCSPQVAGFNRSNHRDNWGALEDLVLKQAAGQRLCVFSGPVLSDGDKRFVGVDERSQVKVQIPEDYWKVIVAVDEGELRSFAFILTQDLSTTPLEFQVTPQWEHHMVSIDELEERLRTVRFPEAVRAADQQGRALGEAIRLSATRLA